MPTRYSPPPRPFLDPPHPSSLPSADKLGLTGANAWSYGISTRLMSDNGRWDLFNLVQGGMVWLDEYMLEIEERLQRGKDEEEVDFVEFVKTPGRNKSAVKTRSEAAINAEKLARINALHFGELTSPSKATTAMDQQATFSHQLPLSATSQTIRPKEINPFNPNPKDDPHVISHEPPTPKTHHSTSQPSIPPNATQAVPAVSTIPAAPVSRTSNTSNERRFGPRPLPQVPNGMRSRTTSNASLMQGVLPQPPAPLFNRPSSMVDIAPVLIPTAIVVPTPTVASSSKAIPLQDRAIAPLPKSSKPSQPAPRTPSPPREEEIGMELDVPLNDTETGRTSIFPTGLNRKPSFSALPDPSPLRKSVRGGVERGKSVERGEAKQAVVNSTTPGNAPNSRTSVRPSSSWFKPKSGVEKTPSTANSSASAGVKSSLDTDEKTAINTAKNAALSAINTVPVGGKRKSDLLETSPVKGKGTDRIVKSAKKAEGAFAGASKDTSTDTFKSTPTENSARSKTPVESSIPAAHTDSEKSAPRSFAMEVEDDTTSVKKLKKADGDDDTAERLFKLRKTLSKVVPLGGESQDSQDGQQQPRSRVDSGAERPRERVDSNARPISRDSSRPASRNTNDQPFPSIAGARNAFERASRVTASTDDQDRSSFKTASERPSHATSDRTRVDSGRLSVSHLVPAWDKKDKEENKRALEETKAAKRKVEEADGRKKETLKRDEVGSGFGLPKWEPPVFNNKTATGHVGKINLMAQSTTPPGSPIPVKSPQVKNEEKIFKEEKHSIFKAPLPTNKNIFTAPSTLQKATTTTQKTTTTAIFREGSHHSQQASQSGISSQSTADEDPLFEKPIKGLKKQGSNSTLGTMSQPSQETHVKHATKDDTAFTWGEEGVTAGWMGGGNDTIGEKQHYQQQQQRRHEEEEEEEELQDDDEWDGDEEDMTNHRWAAIKAGVEAEAMAEPIEEEDEEMAVDEEEEDEDEETQEEPEVKAPAAASSGIFAQVGSYVMKTASSLKSLNMAAAAAEKERKEKEKKDARKKEMEAQRLAKKAEEEKKRREEIEKKRKLEEKRKKEKADTTLNKSLKLTKPQAPSVEKKQPEIKRQPSKLALGTSTKIMPPSASKRAPTPTQAPTIKLVGASNANASTSSLLPLPSINPASSSALPSILGASANKPGAKVTFKPNSMMPIKPTAGPSSGNLMPGARSLEMKAMSTTTTLEVRTSEGGIDENADLPDIKSEYSDSDDESRPRTYNPPEWAQSPDLRQALEDMRSVNPDTIFGAMPDLKMDEIFPGRRLSKFRTRTSSANWAGTDGVTAEEMEEYARRMGFDT